jgi:predicted CXXCH cytochrome family protein
MKPAAPTKHPLEARLEVGSHLPRLWTLCLGAALLTVGALLVWPLARPTARSGWTGGALTNHHRLIEARCDACHRGAFATVADAACTACHQVAEHAASLPALVGEHPTLAVRCTSCHREHHGKANLVPAESQLCTRCHARVQALAPAARLAAFAELASHPELVIEAWSGDPPALGPVPLGTPGLRSTTQLKFSHALHLSHEPEGEPPLTCANCHQAAGDDLTPVSFARSCQRCHALEVELGGRAVSVPHLEAAAVYRFVRGEVAHERWRRRGAPDGALADDAAREAEAALFTEGGACVTCHDVHAEEAGPDEGRFRVDPPVQARVLESAVFRHESHRLSACVDCHGDLRESRSAADVLLPSIDVCRTCHADPGVPGKISSPCLACHGYHEPGLAATRP